MIRCAITDRKRDESARCGLLVKQAARWAAAGVDYIQLREKDLAPARELESLAAEVVSAVSAAGPATRVLINASRADVAVTAGAAGVHLTAAAGELGVADVKRLFALAMCPEPIVSISCHTIADIERARDAGASFFAVFGPVFEKRVQAALVQQGTGLESLRHACRVFGAMPVLALGGVTSENAAACLEAGAAGIAGIRLFLDR